MSQTPHSLPLSILQSHFPSCCFGFYVSLFSLLMRSQGVSDQERWLLLGFAQCSGQCGMCGPPRAGLIHSAGRYSGHVTSIAAVEWEPGEAAPVSTPPTGCRFGPDTPCAGVPAGGHASLKVGAVLLPRLLSSLCHRA